MARWFGIFLFSVFVSGQNLAWPMDIDSMPLVAHFKKGGLSVLVIGSSHSRADGYAIHNLGLTKAVEHADDLILEQRFSRDEVISAVARGFGRSPTRLMPGDASTIAARLAAADIRVSETLLIKQRPFVTYQTVLAAALSREAVPWNASVEQIFAAQIARGSAVGLWLESLDEYIYHVDQLTAMEEMALLEDVVVTVSDATKKARLVAWSRSAGERLATASCATFEREYAAQFLTSPVLASAFHKVVHARDKMLSDRLLTLLASSQRRKSAVAIGAAHLCGASGVFATLVSTGFTLSPLSEF